MTGFGIAASPFSIISAETPEVTALSSSSAAPVPATGSADVEQDVRTSRTTSINPMRGRRVLLAFVNGADLGRTMATPLAVLPSAERRS